MNNDTNKTYINRTNIVIDYIEKNLDKELSLDLLSQKANYSPFHFHRLFKLITRETINIYINRKRVEKIASILLVGTQEPINQLAYRYGFSSGSSFTRAFKNFYGVSPSKFTSKDVIRKIGKSKTTIEKYICQIDNSLNWIKMNGHIEIKELAGMRLIGMTHIGEFNKVADTFKKLMTWMESKDLLNTPNLKAVTLYHDNPKVTEDSKVRLSTCFTIPNGVKAEGALKLVNIQKGYYAVGHFEITTDDFSKAWNGMLTWVLENEYEFEDGHYFELYHNDSKTHPEHKFIVDIYIPIKKPRLEHNRTIKKEQQLANDDLTHYRKQIKQGDIQKDYKTLLTYIKKLRTYFIKTYPFDYKAGQIYQGSMDYSYFTFTPVSLTNMKLKIVIIFNHTKMQFEICLAGRNRQIQKEYWNIFKDSDWNKYHIPDNLKGHSIVDHIIMENLNFNNFNALCQQIEAETMVFIKDIVNVLEA
ncbi:AraC family transcriptional regulator [Flavivirga eckloniae]|uniref:HTH araC/xylS-type domain-containing protein n=1 Tax=Flavivirga eckloniae TaxID=1803846 RepID=A0A2K9PVP2_9FLAO|nr:AraC family transcriptional regulator [Flavivirga eckloniae]AUP81131.1 hypothetical protein C1H87_21405 [Flavivirga eckloniae]